MKKSTSKMVGGGKAATAKGTTKSKVDATGKANATDKSNGKANATAKTNDKNIQVMIFENPEFGKIRTVTDENGEPLFCGKDVCEVLGYHRPYNAVRQHVNGRDTVKRSIASPIKNQRGTCSGKTQLRQLLFVTESGFYALVMGSKLESAQRFKFWVTSVVLPQIRKTGGYIPVKDGDTEEDIRERAEFIGRNTEELLRTIRERDQKIRERDAAIRERDAAIRKKDAKIIFQDSMLDQQKKLLDEQISRIQNLNKQVDEQMVKIQKSAEEIVDLEHDIDRLLPKALYADNVLDSISCYTTTQVAKELGCTAQELNRLLCALHVQYYQSGQYLLYADFAHMGLAKSRTKCGETLLDVGENGFKAGHIYTHTYLVWTERGRKFIHQLLKNKSTYKVEIVQYALKGQKL